MKRFVQFLKEASVAAQQAAAAGLQGDGHGGWYKDGEFVAKTEKGRLVFYNKKQKAAGKDPAQTETEKKYSDPNFVDPAKQQASVDPNAQVDPATGKPVQQQVEVNPELVNGPPPVPKTKGTLTLAFGRFNPPHIGHQKLMDLAASGSEDGDYIIVPSRTQDKKKNPLDADTKISYLRKMFPQHSEKIINDAQNRTIFDVLKKAHMDGYTNVKIYGGSDRTAEFQKLSNNYNGTLYQFDNIEVVDAGKRDKKSESKVERAEASTQRKLAAEGDFDGFREYLPDGLSVKDAKELYNQVRAGMNIKEGWSLWEIAPKLDLIGLRENYMNGNIFGVGQLVENLNTGLIGRIVRRGTNYLICVTEDNIMFKSWIKDVSEALKYSEVKMNRKMRDKEHPNTLVGTEGFRKNVEDKVPYGIGFINRYRKK